MLQTLGTLVKSRAASRGENLHGLELGNEMTTLDNTMAGGRFQSTEYATRDRMLDVFDKAQTSCWQTPELRDRAVESAAGVMLAVENNLPKQAELHLRELDTTCNFNSAQTAVTILQQHGCSSKPFAVCKRADVVIKVQGHGYVWVVASLHQAEELVPTTYLVRVSRLRAHGLNPDSLYVAIPYAENKGSLSEVLFAELQSLILALQAGLAEARIMLQRQLELTREAARKLPDPVLIAGFGYEPVVMVELGRWV